MIITQDEAQDLFKDYFIEVQRGSTFNVEFPNPRMRQWGWVNIQTLSTVLDISVPKLLIDFGPLSVEFVTQTCIPFVFITGGGELIPANEYNFGYCSHVKYVPAGWALQVLKAHSLGGVTTYVYPNDDENLPTCELRWNGIYDEDEGMGYQMFVVDANGGFVEP